MELWRIARRAQVALDGEGARLYGGRWNSAGTAVVYAASHLSLAALEYLVHIDPDDAPDDLVALRLSVPGNARISPRGVAATPTAAEMPDDR